MKSINEYDAYKMPKQEPLSEAEKKKRVEEIEKRKQNKS